MIYKKIDTHAAIFCNVSEEVAQEYIDFRIGIKKPLTQGAFNRAMNQAVECTNLGITANQAIAITIDKGWHGVTPEYIANELNNRADAIVQIKAKDIFNSMKSTRDRSLQEQITDSSWANGIKTIN